MIGGEKLKLSCGLQTKPRSGLLVTGCVCPKTEWRRKIECGLSLSPLSHLLKVPRGCTRNWVCEIDCSGPGSD